MARDIPAEADDAVGDQVRAGSPAVSAGSAPGGRPAQDRAQHGPVGSGGHRDDAQPRNGEESSAVPVEPNMAGFADVSARVTSIPSGEPVGFLASSIADGSSTPASSAGRLP
jgi:hypothetical protein